jgi:hypothetical protein
MARIVEARDRVLRSHICCSARRDPIDIRNRKTDLLRRFEIDDELEFDRLLEGNISWFDAVEMLFT